MRASGREGGKVLLSDKAKNLPALHVYPSGQTPYAAILVNGESQGKKTQKLYLYDRDGRVTMRIDNGAHGHPKQHDFIDEHGRHTSQHYHEAVWQNGSFMYMGGQAVTDRMRKDFPNLLKEVKRE